jgi:hypothetical protein
MSADVPAKMPPAIAVSVAPAMPVTAFNQNDVGLIATRICDAQRKCRRSQC